MRWLIAQHYYRGQLRWQVCWQVRERAYLGCLLTAPLASSASVLTPSSCLKIWSASLRTKMTSLLNTTVLVERRVESISVSVSP